MVYGGRPSTGCYLCIKRKVRCDEASPQCRNCIVYGQPCPGYRPDVIFRDETQKVQRLMKQKKRKTSPARNALTSVSEDKEKKLSLLLTRRIADATWEERSICYFFDQYTSCDDAGSDLPGHLKFLPSLYALCRDSGEEGDFASASLRLAVDATALVTLSNEIQESSLLVKARLLYGTAIQRLQRALYSRTQAVRDETFAAVILLSIFEDITGERNGLSSSHTAGLELLMILRGAKQFGYAQGRDLFNFAYAHTHTEFLVVGDKPRFKTDWISGILDNSDPIHRLMLIAAKVREISLEDSCLQNPDEPNRINRLLSCIERANVVGVELAEWNQHLPEEWLPLIVYAQDHTSLMTHQGGSKAVIWNYYRAIRIVLQKVILRLHYSIASAANNGESHAELLQEEPKILGVIQEMITDICRSIPFAFGYVDALGNAIQAPAEGKLPIRAFQGYSMVWPLWYILSCGLATPEQSHQVRTVLAQVGSTLGIKLALMLAKQADAHDEGNVHGWTGLVAGNQ